MSIFDNTAIAFIDKTTAGLRKAKAMFTAIQYPALTNGGIKILDFSLRHNFPFVENLLRHTLFQQFCGGVSREQSMQVVNQMYRHHIGSIFDYAIEGKEEEATFDQTCREILENIKFAQGNPAIPFVVFKPTGFGRLDLYTYVQQEKALSEGEKAEWQKIRSRFHAVCKEAYERDVVLMVDAEESWIQDAVDTLVNEMMLKFNKDKAIIWNTVQMYRTGRLQYLSEDLERAVEGGYFLGYKFVRGAYMEKERARAAGLGYKDPIQPDKASTDADYNKAIAFAMDYLDRISVFFGTHNEASTEIALQKMAEKSLKHDDPRVHFGQLYGMSDNITYWLGENKYNAAKYLPYGPVKDVVPYLTRRARENTSVAGQTGRELSLINRELRRRKSEAGKNR